MRVLHAICRVVFGHRRQHTSSLTPNARQQRERKPIDIQKLQQLRQKAAERKAK